MAGINFLNDKDEGKPEQEKKAVVSQELQYTQPEKEKEPLRMHKQRWRSFLRSFMPSKEEDVKITIEKFEKPAESEKELWTLPSVKDATKSITQKPAEPLQQPEEVERKEKTPAPLPKLPDIEPRKIEIQIAKEPLQKSKEHKSWFERLLTKKPQTKLSPTPTPIIMPEVKKLSLEKKAQSPKPNRPSFEEIKKPKKENGKLEYTAPKISRPYKGGMNLDVNLVPSDLLATLAPQDKSRSLAGVIAGSVIVILLMYVGLILYDYQLRTKTLQVKDEIQNVDNQTKQYLNLQEEALKLKKHIDATSELLEKHIYWTKFLTELEKVTLQDVYYESISGSTNGAFNLTAFAPSFQAIAEQVRAFEAADFVEKVTVTGGSVQSGSTEGAPESLEGASETAGVKPEVVSFGITLQVKNMVFLSQ
ncbi:MAG: hypothetical protein A3B74_02795 [Candidatus Kerfeldbacteria bacterium RIFCSPHIGHO2_02_FULL_42_14]|uniref:Uncharacterized protein n=1 Tax=Candidatus Kerfeldbacteria bacterium RIFCSPHIGHO2_02_FULL_42_14 TaxID=1798540 RepID=A0A1G2AT51_9BACT|nr:MAG: hypothetical protein A3B74_02795 [Candidatus Kerfeldbacteria bacterium RIFCSPHIGHO2_02_FULL_42_14]OGY80468.1 MAG: hypothetical protein A3E60_05415 [Candidatus Kerfeldbacteria bacterium RIFCSPHIGHO2_12_FULL_42_13]OGY83898.1 MAG: hypothetical protein A3I91_04940 [Candidatus Kerfeldbacteria bacterium RIFCSPLOWO2_02_FULL_42_19]OGY86563.1 MAG: hypothetical protein A3G01_04890 [Candidatus Kerfeldbacteria bacterium RIFCSPLOWO2_12_FULL_43_9]